MLFIVDKRLLMVYTINNITLEVWKMKTTEYVCAACGKEFENSIILKTDVGEYTGCPHCGCWDYNEKREPDVSKKLLKQYVHLVRETNQMETQLSELRAKGESDCGLYEMYENNRLRCMALTMKIQSFIFNIDDSLLRQIFDARYIKGMTWAAIATRLGGYYTTDYIRILHDRFLNSRK